MYYPNLIRVLLLYHKDFYSSEYYSDTQHYSAVLTNSIKNTMSKQVEIDLENQQVRAERKLRYSGGSVVLTIPPEMLDLLDIEEGEQVELESSIGGESLTVRVTEG